MAQISATYKGDPDSLASQLNTLAAANTLQIIQKTVSSGSFVVTYDDAAATGQTVEVLVGDPDALTSRINVIVGLGNTIDLTCATFSAAHYLVVYR